MTMTMSGSGAPQLQRSWDSRAACNFIGGGSGTGLLLAAAVAFAAGGSYFIAGSLAIALIGFGLSMVWLEIGRPLRALNVFFHPQTSWMSREAILALPILALGALAVLLDQPFVPLPFETHLLVAVLASVVAVLGLAFLYCQARILRASLGVPAWREPALQPVIVITGLTEGTRATAVPLCLRGTAAGLGRAGGNCSSGGASGCLGILPAEIEQVRSRFGRRGARPHLYSGARAGARAAGTASCERAPRSEYGVTGGSRWPCASVRGGVAQIRRRNARRLHSRVLASLCAGAWSQVTILRARLVLMPVQYTALVAIAENP